MSPPEPPGGWPQVRTDAGARKIVERLDKMSERIGNLSDWQDDLERSVVKRINARPKKLQVAFSVGVTLVFAGGIVLATVWKMLDGTRSEVRADVQQLRTEVRSDIKELRDVVLKVATQPKEESRRRRQAATATGGGP